MKRKILYISNSLFPYGQAYSTRIVNFARLFNALGYEVHVITDFTHEKFISSETIKNFENCTYQIVAGKATSLNRIKSTFISIKIIEEYINSNKVDYVIIGNCYDRFNRVKKICNKKGIPLLLEICEWFDTKTRKLGNLNPYNILYNRCMKYDYTKADGYITISRYLYEHFSKYSKNIIRIPTILNPDDTPCSVETKNEKVRLVHLGFSGIHKEKFKNILLALELLGEDKIKFEYNIYGSDNKTVLKNIGNDEKLLEKLSDTVKIHGIVNQNQVNNIYMNSDYSIFIRPQKRSSYAGFPTKLAESMIAGTPVITNNTGDISYFMKDGKEGFLLNDDSPTAIAEIFNKIVKHSSEEKKNMRISARKQAEKSFSYKSYTELFNQLIYNINGQ